MYIVDGMKNEGKLFKFITIFGFILSCLMPLAIYWTNDESYDNTDIVLYAVVFFIMGLVGLYGWLYSIKYRIEITDEKIKLKTLFRKIEIDIVDVKKYSCSQYRKSVFYQFKLYINNKNIVISTRYVNELKAILEKNGINEC